MGLFGAGRVLIRITENKRGQTKVPSRSESFRRQPLWNGAYLHVGNTEALVITVGGGADAGMAGTNVQLVGW